jgi:hypothetical protein
MDRDINPVWASLTTFLQVYGHAVGLSVPSQRYITIKEEEVF